MQAKSPSAFFISLTLHGFAAALIFVTTVYFAQPEKVAPVIFDLVAGPSTAPDELVAPALGNTAAPVKPAEAKVEPPPAPEVTKPAEPEVKDPAPPAEVAPKPAAAKAKPDPTLSKDLKKKERIAYQDYLKKHPTPKPAPPSTQPAKAGNVPRIDAQGIANGVRGGSTANTRGGGGGKAMTREEQNLMDTYISQLVQELKKAHEPPPGVSDQLETRVTFDITASGVILNPQIAKSSGNAEFDQSVLEAFRRVRSIGPTPNGKAETWTIRFRMKDAD